jgi:hypothetical protein
MVPVVGPQGAEACRPAREQQLKKIGVLYEQT